MSLPIQAIISVMRERGLSEPDILAVVEAALGAEKRSPAAVRQARYRERLRERDVTSDITRDVTHPDKERVPHTPPKEINPSSLRSELTNNSARASRLPEGWKPGDWGSMVALGASMSQTEGDVSRELDAFRDYWTAKAGKDATKRDWDATFRNWLRNARPKRVNGWNGSKGSTGEAPTGRGRGTYKPGVGLVYPDGTVYSMLHNREP